MKLTADEQSLLRTIGSLADKVLGNKQTAPPHGSMRGPRIRRSRAESAQLKKDILAAIRKGKSVSEISDAFGVTGPYVYQIMGKAGLKGQKRA